MQTTLTAATFRKHACEVAALIALALLPAVPSAIAQRSQKTVPKASVLFAQNCSACHGSDGRGGERAPNIATRQDVVSMPDARLRAIISDGIPSAGMPAFGVLGEKPVDSLVAYLRVLQGMTSGAQTRLPGDPKAGEVLFLAGASCARCHSVKGRGGFMASDLSTFARGRSVAFVENAIAHPPARAGDKDHAVTVETDGGLRLTGLVRAQNNFTLTLQTEDGKFHNIPCDMIRRQTISPHPYMPDYQNLSKEQLDNLASYLLQEAASPATIRVIASTEGSR
ncbi:MAG TPA: c-type cytochrome [Acidobacteriaceae bacterium]|jgi:putative heme-binding domain-containing protein